MVIFISFTTLISYGVMPRRSRKNNGELRLFLAVYPPESVVRWLLEKLRTLDGLPPYRETIPEQVHLTLHFIGNVHPRNMDHLIETIDRAKKGMYQFTVEVERLISYPKCPPQLNNHPPTTRTRSPSLPRLLVAELNQPNFLSELHHRLVQRLAKNPRPRSADRYSPHLTLARFRHFHPAEYPIEHCAWARGGIDIQDLIYNNTLSFRVSQFSLMKSTLLRKGVIHERLADWPLIDKKS